MISKASWASSFSASFPESMHCNNSSASGQQSEKITVAVHHLSACSPNPTHPANLTWSSSKIPEGLAGFEQTLYTLVLYSVGLLSYSWSQGYIHLKSMIKANCILKVIFCICKAMTACTDLCFWYGVIVVFNREIWMDSVFMSVTCFWHRDLKWLFQL